MSGKETIALASGGAVQSVHEAPQLAVIVYREGNKMGELYKCKHKASGRVLDGNSEGEAYTLPWNGTDYQQWLFEQIPSDDEGCYRITQRATGRVLDGNAEGEVYTLPWNRTDYQRWIIMPLGTADGACTFTQKATGRVLDGNLKGEVYTLPGNGTVYQQWFLGFVD